MSRSCYTFGDFQLDASTRRLTRRGEPVPLTEHQADVLLALLSRAGEVVGKDALIEAAWQGVAVTDNSLEQAVSALRKALGDSPASAGLIETVPRRGYRFRAGVARSEPRASDAELSAMLEPYRALVEGRAALETLERDEVRRATRVFEQALERAPDFAAAHVGLANAYVMHVEATRADEAPDADALARAGHHAREACRLDTRSADAWAALALVLYHSRMPVQAIAAARRAVALERDNWRHHLRLAYVGWGEERLRAAHRTLTLFPGFALAHWLGASVYVARGAFDLAADELRAGAAAQDAQQGGGAFRSVGSHWLLGLVHLAGGDEEEADAAFRRELAFEAAGQLHARECAAHTWYAVGALRLRGGRRSEAASAFEQALARVPSHLMAAIGLSVARDAPAERRALEDRVRGRLARLADAGLLVEAAMGRAALAVASGEAADAASVLDEALAAAPGGSAGWLIPVDPLLDVRAHGPAFAHVLTRLRTRAG